MKNSTITTSIFAAALGFTLLSGIPAANAAPTDANTCTTTRTTTTPGYAVQREVSPAVPAVTKVEFEYRHTKNAKQEPRWAPEGWNAEGNPNSDGGWAATGATRVVEVTPAVDAVYETIYIAGTTVQETVYDAACAAGNAGGGNTPPDGNTPAQVAPATGQGIADAAAVTAAGAADAPAAVEGAVVGTEGPSSQAAAGTVSGPEALAAIDQVSASGSLAETGAGGINAMLALGALAAGGGAALFGAAKLRTRQVAG